MKRNVIVGQLIKEGFSEKTLVKFSDKQLFDLHERIVTTTKAMAANPDIQKLANDPTKTVEVKETLKGKQKNIDKNHNGKIDAEDFAILNKEKKGEVKETEDCCSKCGKKVCECGKKKDMNEADMGLTVKAPKSSGTSVFGGTPKKSSSPKKKTTPKKKEGEKTEEGDVDESLNGIVMGAIKDKLTKDLGREPEDHEMDKAHEDFINNWIKNDEKKKNKHNPKDGKKKEKEVDELLRFYDDDGNPIKNKKGKQDAVSTKSKNFEKKTKSKKCADCGEYTKDCKCDHSHLDESRNTKNWVKNLVENKKFHSFTSKNEIMELIQTKLTESETMTHEFGPKVKKGHNGIPEFMTYDAIVSAEPKTAPTKPAPSTKPGTKPRPTRREDPRKTPFQPGPGPNPKPKAKIAEDKKKK